MSFHLSNSLLQSVTYRYLPVILLTHSRVSRVGVCAFRRLAVCFIRYNL